MFLKAEKSAPRAWLALGNHIASPKQARGHLPIFLALNDRILDDRALLQDAVLVGALLRTAAREENHAVAMIASALPSAVEAVSVVEGVRSLRGETLIQREFPESLLR